MDIQLQQTDDVRRTQPYNLVERFRRTPVTLIPLQPDVSIATLVALKQFPTQKIAVCDFRVKGSEAIGVRKPYGFYLPQHEIYIIDHHGEGDERMERWISSGNLADLFIDEHGTFSGNQLVVAHHFDCDSIISSSKVRGILPREQRFNDAVIAADHSGASHPIGDLMTSLEDARKGSPLVERYQFCLHNLETLLNNEPLNPEATQLLSRLLGRRIFAGQMVQEGKIHRAGDIFWGNFDTEVDPELFLPHLPDAKLIITSYPMHKAESLPATAMRFVLGQAAPKGLNLSQLDIPSIDPHYGGRWNRGSNRRSGGTQRAPHEYVQLINARLIQLLSA